MFIVKLRLRDEVVHPGVILLQEYLLPCQISQTALAVQLGVPPRRINEIVLGKRAITADTAVRLEAALGMTAHYWMGLQSDYEIKLARRRGVDSQVNRRPDYGRSLYDEGVPF